MGLRIVPTVASRTRTWNKSLVHGTRHDHAIEHVICSFNIFHPFLSIFRKTTSPCATMIREYITRGACRSITGGFRVSLDRTRRGTANRTREKNRRVLSSADENKRRPLPHGATSTATLQTLLESMSYDTVYPSSILEKAHTLPKNLHIMTFNLISRVLKHQGVCVPINISLNSQEDCPDQLSVVHTKWPNCVYRMIEVYGNLAIVTTSKSERLRLVPSSYNLWWSKDKKHMRQFEIAPLICTHRP